MDASVIYKIRAILTPFLLFDKLFGGQWHFLHVSLDDFDD